VEKSSQRLTRVMLGLNPAHLSWPLAPGGKISSPECVSVYSHDGFRGMSRAFHSLYRNHLM
jgi:alpha-galactosidase